MKSMFSVDEFDSIWQTTITTTTNSDTAPSTMNRCPSEWDLDIFLHEEQQQEHFPPPLTSSINNPLPPSHDFDEYQRTLLKSKLEIACAAAAKALGSSSSSVKPEGGSCSSLVVGDQRGLVAAGPGSAQLMAPHVALGASQIKPRMQHEADVGLPGVPALPASVQKKQDVQVRQTTSGSSREDSDDDELEGDTGTNENTDPADVKRARRMQSNRESARRSRRRKQEQLNDLESQVGKLRDERTSLLSHLSGINQKCDEAAVDNRILKADIETLRAKVQMAEEQVKRATGLNPMLLARSNMTSMGSPLVGGQVDAASKFAVPTPPLTNPFFHQPIPSVNSAPLHPQPLKNSFSNIAVVPHSASGQTDNVNTQNGTYMQLPAAGPNLVGTPSDQFVQNHIGPAVNPGGALPRHDWGVPKSGANDNK